jgi:hypothetical protein
LKAKDHLENQNINGKILKWSLKKQDMRVCSGSNGFVHGPTEGSNEYGNELQFP